MWAGTLRENVDPLGKFTDEQIKSALAEVRLFETPPSPHFSKPKPPTSRWAWVPSLSMPRSGVQEQDGASARGNL